MGVSFQDCFQLSAEYCQLPQIFKDWQNTRFQNLCLDAVFREFIDWTMRYNADIAGTSRHMGRNQEEFASAEMFFEPKKVSEFVLLP